MTIAQIKALFQTGKIPTQADFENLISKIPNSELTGGGNNTLSFSDPDYANVLGYRFVTIGDEASYLFIGFYDAENATYLPYIIVHCNTGSPSKYGNTPPVKYTIIYTDFDYTTYVYNCIMGMGNIDFIVPICIHSLIKLRDVEDDNYSGAMSILQRTVYNYMTVKSEWEKIMKLQGYEDGLVIDDSGVAENFMNTIHANCYKQIQLK